MMSSVGCIALWVKDRHGRGVLYHAAARTRRGPSSGRAAPRALRLEAVGYPTR
jgi:hypothetical protein